MWDVLLASSHNARNLAMGGSSRKNSESSRDGGQCVHRHDLEMRLNDVALALQGENLLQAGRSGRMKRATGRSFNQWSSNG